MKLRRPAIGGVVVVLLTIGFLFGQSSGDPWAWVSIPGATSPPFFALHLNFPGDGNFLRVNGIRYVASFPGSDIGAQFMNALADCGSTYGCIVQLPQGIFPYSTQMVIKTTGTGITVGRGLTVRGAGNDATILQWTCNSCGNDGLVIGDLASNSSATFNTLKLRLSDFTIKSTVNPPSVVHCFNSGGVIFDNVTIDGTSGNGTNGLKSEYCQYVQMYSGWVSGGTGGAGWALNVPQAVIPGYTRGTNEQTNNWDVYGTFFSGSAGCVRLQAARDMKFDGAQFQNCGTNGGLISTADSAGAIGGAPAGSPSGAFTQTTTCVNCHFELNAGNDYNCQFCTQETIDSGEFYSSGVTNHILINSNAFIVHMSIRNPYFGEATQNAINVGALSLNNQIDIGNATATKLLGVLPTISSGFGTAPAITNPAAQAGYGIQFRLNVGTGGTATSGVVGLPTATNGWNCAVGDITTPATNLTRESASSTTSATLTNYSTAGVATAWPASDVLAISCFPF